MISLFVVGCLAADPVTASAFSQPYRSPPTIQTVSFETTALTLALAASSYLGYSPFGLFSHTVSELKAFLLTNHSWISAAMVYFVGAMALLPSGPGARGPEDSPDDIVFTRLAEQLYRSIRSLTDKMVAVVERDSFPLNDWTQTQWGRDHVNAAASLRAQRIYFLLHRKAIEDHANEGPWHDDQVKSHILAYLRSPQLGEIVLACALANYENLCKVNFQFFRDPSFKDIPAFADKIASQLQFANFSEIVQALHILHRQAFYKGAGAEDSREFTSLYQKHVASVLRFLSLRIQNPTVSASLLAVKTAPPVSLPPGFGKEVADTLNASLEALARKMGACLISPNVAEPSPNQPAFWKARPEFNTMEERRLAFSLYTAYSNALNHSLRRASEPVREHFKKYGAAAVAVGHLLQEGRPGTFLVSYALSNYASALQGLMHLKGMEEAQDFSETLTDLKRELFPELIDRMSELSNHAMNPPPTDIEDFKIRAQTAMQETYVSLGEVLSTEAALSKLRALPDKTLIVSLDLTGIRRSYFSMALGKSDFEGLSPRWVFINEGWRYTLRPYVKPEAAGHAAGMGIVLGSWLPFFLALQGQFSIDAWAPILLVGIAWVAARAASWTFSRRRETAQDLLHAA